MPPLRIWPALVRAKFSCLNVVVLTLDYFFVMLRLQSSSFHSLDLLGDGHEVAAFAGDDERADMSQPRDPLCGVQAELDVRAAFCGRAKRNQLNQFDSAL